MKDNNVISSVNFSHGLLNAITAVFYRRWKRWIIVRMLTCWM